MKNIKSSIQSYFLTGVFALLSISVQAQPETKQWTLEECINHALENNIQIQQSELNLLITNQNLAQSKYGMLPNINGFASHTYNFGQTIDPFTNQFATSQVRSNSLSLSSSVTLFNGFQTLNTVKKNQADLQASRFDMEKMQNDISLNIANFYLQILFSHELVKNAERQLQVTSGQITRIQKLVDAGSLPEGNLREIQAQYASEELQKINAENQLNITTLNLAQILRLEDASNFDVVMPNLESFQGVSGAGTGSGRDSADHSAFVGNNACVRSLNTAKPCG